MLRILKTLLRRARGQRRNAPSSNSVTGGEFFLSANPAYAKYKIGQWSYGTPEVYSWGEGAHLIIGKYCSIAAGVKIYLGGEHRTDWVTTYPFNVIDSASRTIPGHPKTKGNVVVENDVWIGNEAVILSGVTLGNGCVVGARSVVTKSVPPYTIVAGNPAKVIRTRFSEAVVRELLEIAWWEWPDDKVRSAIPHLLSTDIVDFITYAKSQAAL